MDAATRSAGSPAWGRRQVAARSRERLAAPDPFDIRVDASYLAPMPTKLSAAECEAVIRDGDFSQSIRGSSPAVATVLTQSWCPQWRMMRSYLENVEARGGVRVFYVEYDREPFFEEFMTFKEDVFGNREVPYVRYYRDGVLTSESNFISEQGFLTRLGVL